MNIPPSGSPAGQPSPRLVRFTEPGEGAFSLVVPEGWRVESGLVRNGNDARPWYRVLSPGGGAELRGSDPRLPHWFSASPFAFMGMPQPGVAVRPYVPAAAFAMEYAHHFARERGAQTVNPTGTRSTEAILRGDPDPERRAKSEMLLRQGAELAGVTFTCPDRGLSGLVDVMNLRMPGPAGLMWAPFITAMAGPSDAWPHVEATLLAIAQSYLTSPAWQRFQSQMQQAQHEATMESLRVGSEILRMQAQSGMEAIHAHAQRAHISAQTSAEVSAMQSQSWQRQQDASDEAQRRAVNAVRETVDLYDPATGQVYRGAPAGFTSYWTDGADRVVASTSHENPDASRFTQATDLDDLHRPPRR